MKEPEDTAYEFGPFRLEPGERRLLREGRPVILTARLFDILLLLVAERGNVVTKETLMREVWSDSFVEENNLTVSMSSLRKILGERYKERRYIETVTKRGYRFVARVRQVRGGSDGVPAAGRPEPGGEEWGPGAPDAPANSVAVLPFLNAGGSPDLEYLSDGITESIIVSISRLPGLRVMARSTVFRYKGREVDAMQVGRELKVRAVLCGSLREFNGRLILWVEMVDAADGSQIWGETYNRPLSDIFGIQEEIAGELSEKLSIGLRGEERARLTRRHTQDSEVYYLYLKGRYFWNKWTVKDVERAVKYFEESLRRESAYAPARAGLADCYLSLIFLNALSFKEGIPAVRREAAAALSLDETMAEAHSALGYIEMTALNWGEADRGLRRAVELDPNNAVARRRYSYYLACRGRMGEAIAQAERALSIDPLSPHMQMSTARVLYYAGRHERALEVCRQTLEMAPDFGAAHGVMGLVYEGMGMYEEAISELRRALELLGNDDAEALGLLGYVYGVAGRRREARRVLTRLLKLSREKYASPLFMAWVYAGLRESNEAFEWLERACEERSYVTNLAVSTLFDYLRPDPRYGELLRRCGLPLQLPPQA